MSLIVVLVVARWGDVEGRSRNGSSGGRGGGETSLKGLQIDARHNYFFLSRLFFSSQARDLAVRGASIVSLAGEDKNQVV